MYTLSECCRSLECMLLLCYRYEEQMKEKNVLQKEDLSDMVAEHAAKQKVSSFFQQGWVYNAIWLFFQKRKRAAADSGGKVSKKLKEFKF